MKLTTQLQSRLEKQAFQDLISKEGFRESETKDQLQSRLEKQAFQANSSKAGYMCQTQVAIPPRKAGISSREFDFMGLGEALLVAIPPRKAGISR